jgi:hypothetical protein
MKPLPDSDVNSLFILLWILVIIPVVLALYWIMHRLAPKLLRDWQNKNYKNAIIAALAIALSVITICFLGASMVPPSHITIHRDSLLVGYENLCKGNPRFAKCESSSNCEQCVSQAGCLEAVDQQRPYMCRPEYWCVPLHIFLSQYA